MLGVFMVNKILEKIQNLNYLKYLITAIMALSVFISVSTIIKAENYWNDSSRDSIDNVVVSAMLLPQESGFEVGSVVSEDNTIKVGNYKANLIYGFDQNIADMPNTAALFSYGGKTYIADHSYQGFSAIRWNDTAVVNGQTYHLVSRYYGTWGEAIQGRTIFLPSGEEMWYCDEGSLVMYTCVGTGVVITYWE